MRHELIGDFTSERRIKTATDVDRRQFLALTGVVGFEFLAFTLDVRLLCVGLRVHGDILAGRHRHRAGGKA